MVVVDDLSKGLLANIEHNLGNPRFDFVQMDVRDRERLLEVGAGCQAVIHLAAAKIPRYSSALLCVTSNVDGARSAIDVARANEAKFVLASTSDVYGNSPDLPFREDGRVVLGPSTTRRWAYAVSKLCDEHLAYAYRDEYALRVSVLRFFGTYGHRQYLNWWGGPQGVFLEAIAKGEPVEVHGDGEQTRSFIYVTDLVEGITRALESDKADGETINIGNDEEISIRGLAELMYETSGLKVDLNIRYVPYAQLPGNYQDVLRRVPDLGKMKRLLDFEPRVSLRDGLTQLWDWYRKRTVSS